MNQLTQMQKRLIVFLLVSSGFCLCVCLIVLGIILISERGEAQASLPSLNGGYGDVQNPVPANNVIYFGDFNVLPLYYMRPATDLVRSFNPLNRPTSSGRDYVLVRFRMECLQEKCKGSQLNIHVIDANGQEWGRPIGILLEENLEGMDFIQGGIVEGWQVFEIPSSATLKTLRLWSDRGTLYTTMPRQQN
jgi:hypothetical protein